MATPKINWLMLISNLTLLLAFASNFPSTNAAGHSFDEKCEDEKNVTTKSSSGTTTLDIIKDSCDTDQFLKCQNMRCICQDPANQIFQPKQHTVERVRSRRSPKKSGSSGGGRKGIAIGIGAGVIGGVGAYQISKAIDHAPSYHPTSYGHSSQSDHKRKMTTLTVKKCYTRVGGNCAINLDHTRFIVRVQNTTVNGSTTTTTDNIQVNYRKEMSECVENAECTRKATPGEDTNIGVCVCSARYTRDPKLDICIKKQDSGAGNLIGTTKTGLLILIVGSYIFA